jgi:hypothetical protein
MYVLSLVKRLKFYDRSWTFHTDGKDENALPQSLLHFPFDLTSRLFIYPFLKQTTYNVHVF